MHCGYENRILDVNEHTKAPHRDKLEEGLISRDEDQLYIRIWQSFVIA